VDKENSEQSWVDQDSGRNWADQDFEQSWADQDFEQSWADQDSEQSWADQDTTVEACWMVDTAADVEEVPASIRGLVGIVDDAVGQSVPVVASNVSAAGN